MGGFGAFQVGGFSPAPRWLQALAARRLFGVMLSISGHLRRGGLGGWLRPRDPGGRRTCGPWDLFRLQVPASALQGRRHPSQKRESASSSSWSRLSAQWPRARGDTVACCELPAASIGQVAIRLADVPVVLAMHAQTLGHDCCAPRGSQLQRCVGANGSTCINRQQRRLRFVSIQSHHENKKQGTRALRPFLSNCGLESDFLQMLPAQVRLTVTSQTAGAPCKHRSNEPLESSRYLQIWGQQFRFLSGSFVLLLKSATSR